ncbi:MAG: hypothetical protein ACWA5A_17685 [Marinibacterium sp.]
MNNPLYDIRDRLVWIALNANAQDTPEFVFRGYVSEIDVHIATLGDGYGDAVDRSRNPGFRENFESYLGEIRSDCYKLMGRDPDDSASRKTIEKNLRERLQDVIGRIAL